MKGKCAMLRCLFLYLLCWHASTLPLSTLLLHVVTFGLLISRFRLSSSRCRRCSREMLYFYYSDLDWSSCHLCSCCCPSSCSSSPPVAGPLLPRISCFFVIQTNVSVVGPSSLGPDKPRSTHMWYANSCGSFATLVFMTGALFECGYITST